MREIHPERGKAVSQAPQVTELSHRTPAGLRLEGSLTFISLQPPAMGGTPSTKKFWITCEVLFHTMNEGSVLKNNPLYLFFEIIALSEAWAVWQNLNEDSSLSQQPHQVMTSQERTFEQKSPFLHKSNVHHGCVTGRSESLQLFLVDKEYIAQNIYRF